jgi:hypothetical protein
MRSITDGQQGDEQDNRIRDPGRGLKAPTCPACRVSCVVNRSLTGYKPDCAGDLLAHRLSIAYHNPAQTSGPGKNIISGCPSQPVCFPRGLLCKSRGCAKHHSGVRADAAAILNGTILGPTQCASRPTVLDHEQSTSQLWVLAGETAAGEPETRRVPTRLNQQVSFAGGLSSTWVGGHLTGRC